MRSIRFLLCALLIPILVYSMNEDRVISPKPDTSSTPVPKGVTAKMIIDKSINAIGGKNNILKVKNKFSIMNANVDGMPIIDTIWQKLPHLYNSTIFYYTVGKTTIFDGEKAQIRDMYGPRLVTGDDLEELRFQSDLTAMVNLEKLKIKTNLIGIKRVFGRDCYQVEFTFPTGFVMDLYFDMATGYKLREERELKTPSGTYLKATDYLDFREVKGVKYPYIIMQTVEGKGLSFKVTKLEVNTKFLKDVFK